MTSAELLTDCFGRVRETVSNVLAGLSASQLAFRPADEANSIGWLVWHLSRIQDDHVASAFDRAQVWTASGWQERFALPFDAADTGYSHSADQVAAVRVSGPELLADYHDAVHAQTMQCLAGLGEDDLARVVDRRWDPPVTLGVRLVSVVSDDLQHVGQAAYVRGLAERTGTD
ncbi:MAG TPA: DUF664 domain-containing protein [Nocardioidaceae bacterium]|nr:DUF664 domain-containing protein [Nocardioidaceae bacterium]